MKNLALIFISIAITSCGGGLSDQQRKALKEEMDNREVKKIKEEEIVAETFKVGKKIFNSDKNEDDSLANLYKAEVYIIKSGDSTRNKVDWKLLEAYEYSLTQGNQPSDNVQRDGEIMVYTQPYISEEMYQGIYVIRIPRKQIVLNM